MALLKQGIVKEFDLFEVSAVRIEQGQQQYQKEGLTDRVNWRQADGIEALESGRNYDLVFWDNSLHHMPDTQRAVQASVAGLRPGGVFLMNDYVGANRFQWSDRELRYASMVRGNLPDRFFQNPWNPKTQLRKTAVRPTVEGMIAADPSEAADSERILPSISATMPEAKIWLLGGVIYRLALNDVIANLDEKADLPLLEMALTVEAALIELGESQYAACISVIS